MKDIIERNKEANERWLARKTPTLEDLRERTRKRIKSECNTEFYRYVEMDRNPVKKSFNSCRG